MEYPNKELGSQKRNILMKQCYVDLFSHLKNNQSEKPVLRKINELNNS